MKTFSGLQAGNSLPAAIIERAIIRRGKEIARPAARIFFACLGLSKERLFDLLLTPACKLLFLVVVSLSHF